jgi:DNA processing protein
LKEKWFHDRILSSSNPDKENFVRRNRIVAGMSEATIVIESADRGGSLITANILTTTTEMFSRFQVTDKYSQGCNNLIKHKKNVLTSAADLVYILNWDIQKERKPVQKQLFVILEDDEQKSVRLPLKNGKELMDIIAL